MTATYPDEQLCLRLDALPDPPPPPLTNEERWERFHAEHPEVAQRLRELALELRAAGITHYGIRTLWERLRWEQDLKGVSDADGWKLNNVYTPFYARLLMETTPELARFFETRDRRAA